MNNDPHIKKHKGFFREGLSEFKRKWNRKTLKKRKKKCNQSLNTSILELGSQAWKYKILPPNSNNLFNSLSSMSTESDTLTEKQSQIHSQIREMEENQKKHIDENDKKINDIDIQYREIYKTYSQLEETISNQKSKYEQAQTRLESIPSKIEAIRNQIKHTDDLTDSNNKEINRYTVEQLEQEQDALKEFLIQANHYIDSVSPQVEDMKQQLNELYSLLNKAKTERSDILEQDKKAIQQLQISLNTTTTQHKHLNDHMDVQFIQLGNIVMDTGINEPRIDAIRQQIISEKKLIENLNQELNLSYKNTASVPANTMIKFIAALIVIPLLIIILPVAAVKGTKTVMLKFNPKPVEQKHALQGDINPYLKHNLEHHQAYWLAKRFSKTRSTQDIKRARKEFNIMCKSLNLGIYTPGGRKLLAGSEKNADDFFIYDFMRDILTRSYVQHNVMNFDSHTLMLSQILLKTEDSEKFDKEFKKALVKRYHDAKENPDKAESFLPLLIDGLSRHHVIPYSLNELDFRDSSQLELDDIQSFLLMLDFFIPKNDPSAITLRNIVNNLLPKAYAGSLCDEIAGNGTKSAWGDGLAILTGATAYGSDAVKEAGEYAGNASLIMSLIGDIIILRGIQLKILPVGGVMINLPHTKKNRNDRTLPTFTYTAVATFEAELSEEVIDCGWIAGLDFPKNGPLENVEITWDFEPPLVADWSSGNQGKNAKVMLHDAGEFVANMRMLTDKNGKATITLRAMPCPEPDGKALAGQYHKVSASARFVSAQMPNPLSALGGPSISIAISMLPGFYEIATGGRKAYSTLDVGWHEKKPDGRQY